MSKYINADETALAVVKATTYGGALRAVREQPTIDIVRCKECRWCKEEHFPNGSQLECRCERKDYEMDDEFCGSTLIVNADDFCSWGERKE